MALGIAASLFLGIGANYKAQAQSAIPLCEISRNLYVGLVGEDVRCLQRYLNYSGYPVAGSGVGSSGNETTYFGSRTQDAVRRWQEAHAPDVLHPIGLTQGTGFWGARSFNKYVSIVRIALGLSQ